MFKKKHLPHLLVLEEDGVAVAVLPRKEVVRRLRDRNEPILLFAETEIEAFRRLRKLEISEPEINRVSWSSQLASQQLSNLKLFSLRVFVMIFKKLWSEMMKLI